MTTSSQQEPAASVFAPVVDGQTYRNVAFLLTSFPLGMAYFVGTMLGLSLGAGLAVLGVGLPILLATLLGLRAVAALERWRVRVLLGRRIERPADPSTDGGFLGRLRTLLGSASIWRTVGYVVFVFGYGVAGFTVAVVGVTTGLAFLSAPLIYDTAAVSLQFGVWEPTTFAEALLLVPIGVGVLVAAAYACNRIAPVGGSIAATLLGPVDRSGA